MQALFPTLRRRAFLGLSCAAWPAAAAVNGAARPGKPAAAPEPALPGALPVEEIVRRNVAARGGAEAWGRVRTLRWSGVLQSGSAKGTPPLPFTMDLARPNRSRFEVQGMQVRFIRVFDGEHGWKVRPGRNGPEVQDFSADEVKFHQDEFVLAGLLIDHVAKRIAVVLEGINELEGRRAWRLGLRLPSGASRRLWVDAETFLEVRCDRPSWNPLVRGKAVSTLFRDYQAFEGLKVPTRIESGPAVEESEGPPPRDVLIVQQVQLNPELAEQAFARPKAMRSHGALVQVPANGAGAFGAPVQARPAP